MGFFSSSDQKSRPPGGKTIIAAGCRLRGEVSRIEGDILFEGEFEGVIESDYDLAVASKGLVKGLIKSKHIVVSGVLEGKVICDHLEVLNGGKFIGEIVAENISIEKGGKFIGQSHEMTETGTAIAFNEAEKRAVTEAPETIAQLEIDQVVEMVVIKPEKNEQVQNLK
ncbi:hypothetical protein JCM17795_00120 [Galenea microaerophila]